MIVITMARRPILGAVAQTVLQQGTGALHIQAARIPLVEGDDIIEKNPHTVGGFGHANSSVYGKKGVLNHPGQYDPVGLGGRWPANIVLNSAVDIGDPSRFFRRILE